MWYQSPRLSWSELSKDPAPRDRNSIQPGGNESTGSASAPRPTSPPRASSAPRSANPWRIEAEQRRLEQRQAERLQAEKQQVERQQAVARRRRAEEVQQRVQEERRRRPRTSTAGERSASAPPRGSSEPVLPAQPHVGSGSVPSAHARGSSASVPTGRRSASPGRARHNGRAPGRPGTERRGTAELNKRVEAERRRLEEEQLRLEAERRHLENEQRRVQAEASSRRIASGGNEWYAVLNLPATACVHDVKRAFRELALLHHPDKSLETCDGTFKRVQMAYQQGLRLAPPTPSVRAVPSSTMPPCRPPDRSMVVETPNCCEEEVTSNTSCHCVN